MATHPPPLTLLLFLLLLLTTVLTRHTDASPSSFSSSTLYKDGGNRGENANIADNTGKDEEDKPSYIYPVDCPDGKEWCQCPLSATSCKFILIVEELQTFTSYKMVEVREKFLDLMVQKRVRSKGTVRSTAGDIYYLDGRGYTPTLPPWEDSDRQRPPEYGKCYFNDTVVFSNLFRRKDCTVPVTADGATFRMFVGVNGQLPGPTLIVYEGQEVQVKVINKLTSEGISVHWHGMRQVGTPWMDGVGFVSQPPIVAGAAFDYVFKAEPAGTHWYHSHVGAQRTDGLFGGLVVMERGRNKLCNMGYEHDKASLNSLQDMTYVIDNIFNNDDNGYAPRRHDEDDSHNTNNNNNNNNFEDDYRGKLLDAENTSGKRCNLIDTPQQHTITLLDWQSESSLNLFVRIHSTLGYYPGVPVGRVATQLDGVYRRTHSTDGIEVGPVPFWSGLMNGRGRHDRDTFAVLSTFNVLRWRGHRFRLIGAQSLYAFRFSVENHRLQLIATDGHFVHPEAVDYIIVHTGERYDFILYADQEPGNYWMRAETLEADARERHQVEGILHYYGYHDEMPTPNNKYTNIPVRERQCREEKEGCVAVNCPFKEFPSEMKINCMSLDRLRAMVLPSGPMPKILRPHQPSSENLLFFNFGFEGLSSTSAINGMNFKLPTTPYQTYCDQYDIDKQHGDILCDTRSSVSDRSNSYPVCTNVAQIATEASYALGDRPSVNFILSSVGDIERKNNNFSHPIHLHGHQFYVVAVRYGDYDSDARLVSNNSDIDCHEELCRNPTWRNDTLPPYLDEMEEVPRGAVLKDTVIVPAGGYVVVAFLADNPGYWFMHCHIESHQLEGMAVVVQEFPARQQWAPPPGINRVGNFSWDVESQEEFVREARMCGLN